MSLTPIYHNKVYAHQGDAEAVEKVIASGNWACGSEVTSLERELADYTGRKEAVCVSSGLSALRLALWSIGVKSGDEVIIPAYCCVALANACLQLGAVPVPADIENARWTIDPGSVNKKVSVKTKAIIAVHTFGCPADIRGLKEVCQDKNITIIEDCAHGFGPVGGRVLGSDADIAVTSLYATKFLGCGEGGVILLNNSEKAAELRKFRNYGDQPPHNLRGNDKMTDIEASLARNRLKQIAEDLRWRQSLAEMYYDKLFPLQYIGYIKLPDIKQARIWYRFPIIIQNSDAEDCIKKINMKQIFIDRAVTNWLTEKIIEYPVSFYAYNNLISLPFHKGVSKKHVEYIADMFKEYFEKESREE
jgi:perosamine synthetase